MARQYKQFQFKQFSVADDRCSMKVGTDAVLLGAWVNAAQATRILDIGAGSGVISLMLAQKTAPSTRIDAIEIEPKDANQARENIQKSAWRSKIDVHNIAIQKFQSDRLYDLLVSNPPYFIGSLLPPSDDRKTARHAVSLSYEELLKAVARLILPNGKFCVVLPTAEGNRFMVLARKDGLYPARKLAFYTRQGKPQERWLLEFSFEDVVPTIETLYLYSEDQEWASEYKLLTNDFYL